MRSKSSPRMFNNVKMWKLSKTREYTLLEILFFFEKINLYIPKISIQSPIGEVIRDCRSTRRYAELHFISPFIVAHGSNYSGRLGKKDRDHRSIRRVTESPFARQVDLIHGLWLRKFWRSRGPLSKLPSGYCEIQLLFSLAFPSFSLIFTS